MGNGSKKESGNTIAKTINRTLWNGFSLIVAVVILIAGSLFVFTKYTAVVNSAGIVRGGSQRVVKLVLAGADESAAVGVVETNLSQIEKQMRIGKFKESRNEVENYWNKTIKKDIEEFKVSGDFTVLLADSETLFQMTNQMVYDAQDIGSVCSCMLFHL